MATEAEEAAILRLAGSPYPGLYEANIKGDYNKGQQGVFALNPLMTPKYAKNEGLRDNEFKETLARMYLSLADSSEQARAQFMRTIPNDERVRALAKVLALTDTGFIDFFLQQVTESYSETVQIDKVLGDNYVAFFFGQEPPVFQYAGSLLNSMQDDQRTGFGLAYQHLIRGSQLAKRGGLLRLRYDSTIVSGTLLGTSQTMNAENELVVPFQFSMLVKEVIWLQPHSGTKLSPQDFVQLSTLFARDVSLSDVGRAQDVRVRTTIDLPPENVLAGDTPQKAVVDQAQNTATVGANDPADTVDGGKVLGIIEDIVETVQESF